MALPMSAYQMAINNTARYIRSQRNLDAVDGGVLDGFTAATVLAVAFCKMKEEVLSDIMLVGKPPVRVHG